MVQEVEQDPSKSQAPPPPAKKFFSKFKSPPSAAPLKPPESGSPSNQPIENTVRLRPDDSITLSDDIIPPWAANSISSGIASSPSTLYDRSVPSPPVMPNPFASSSSGSLAFGSLDGSVNGGMGFQADPWSIASSTKKTTLDSYDSHSPWS